MLIHAEGRPEIINCFKYINCYHLRVSLRTEVAFRVNKAESHSKTGCKLGKKGRGWKAS